MRVITIKKLIYLVKYFDIFRVFERVKFNFLNDGYIVWNTCTIKEMNREER